MTRFTPEGLGASSADAADRATDAPHEAPSGLRPDGSVSTGAGVTRVSPQMLAAWVAWDPGYEPPPPLSVRQAGFVRQAFYAGWLASEQDRASPWQPIETAPKDGTDVLLFEPVKDDQIVMVGYWEPHGENIHNGKGEAGWSQSASGYTGEIEPTHWMPLPAPPASGIEGEAGDAQRLHPEGESPVDGEAGETPNLTSSTDSPQ